MHSVQDKIQRQKKRNQQTSYKTGLLEPSATMAAPITSFLLFVLVVLAYQLAAAMLS